MLWAAAQMSDIPPEGSEQVGRVRSSFPEGKQGFELQLKRGTKGPISWLQSCFPKGRVCVGLLTPDADSKSTPV